MSSNSCSRCGSTISLRKHHVSYIPEVVEIVCRKCDAKERRTIPSSRGFKILKIYPQRGMVLIPKDTLMDFGSDLLELEKAPVSPVAIIFKCGLPIQYLKEALQILIKNIELREEIEIKR